MKRTIFVCVLAVALMAMLALPALSYVEIFKVSIAGPTAPAFINYQLDCAVTTVTFEIWTSVGGVPTVKVYTDVQAASRYTSKGTHTYLWPCVITNPAPPPLLLPAPAGSYLCKIIASHTPAGWTSGYFPGNSSPWRLVKTIGTYRQNNPQGPEYGSWNPGSPAVSGFYGTAVNTNPDSEYYGRYYSGHWTTKKTYIYDCDGAFLKSFGSDQPWQPSAPYNAQVAKDGYVYMADRSAGTTRLLNNAYCFTGDGVFVSAYPWDVFGLCHRLIWAVQTPDNVTHIYHYASVGAGDPPELGLGEAIWHQTVQPDHTTWSTPTLACNPPDGLGLWVSADRSYMYVCEGQDSINKVRRWKKDAGETYSRDSTWTVPATVRWPKWQPNTAYSIDINPDVDPLIIEPDVMLPTSPNSHVYTCKTSGISGPTEPAWNTGTGDTTDNTVVWSNGGQFSEGGSAAVCETPDGDYLWIGQFVSSGRYPLVKIAKWAGFNSSAWVASHGYVLNNMVNGAAGFKYQCIQAGTSDVAPPAWPTTEGATVVDGGVIWKAWSTTARCYNNVMGYPKMLQCDALGNVVITGGYGSSSWPSVYWAVGTEGNGAQTYTRQKQTGAFLVTADPAPVVVPDSATWSFNVKPPVWQATTAYVNDQVIIPTAANWNGYKYKCFIGGVSGATEPTWYTGSQVTDGTVTWDPYGKVELKPSGGAPDTVDLTFKVLDASGTADIGAVTVNLSSLNLAGPPVVVNAAWVSNDPDGMTATYRILGITAVAGTRAGNHGDILVTVKDVHDPNPPANTDTFDISIMGATFQGTVKHIDSNALIGGATMTIVGGTAGVYGSPFTYVTDTTSFVTGKANIPISAGDFTVQATKTGYKEQAVIPFNVAGGQIGNLLANRDVFLGPISIAEMKALPIGTVCSVAGICYAQPEEWEYDFEADPMVWKHKVGGAGLGMRVVYTTPTSGVKFRQWYMCDAGAGDPGGATNGMEFALPPPTDDLGNWGFSWEATDFDATIGIGAIPAQGDLIWVKGMVNWLPGYEKYCIVQYQDFADEQFGQTFNWTYWNKSAASMPSPVSRTISQIYHGTQIPLTPYAIWGTYATVAGATAVRFEPNFGAYPVGAYTAAFGEGGIWPPGTPPQGGQDMIVVANSAGNWCTISPQDLASLELTVTPPPVDVGSIYTFTGAGGRRGRYGVGTLRIRGASDIVVTTPKTPPDPNISDVRGVWPAYGLDLRGVVTMKNATSGYLYVESPDISSGVRVISNSTKQQHVSVGDDIWFTGDTTVLDGQKQVTPTTVLAVISHSNPMPYLGIRTRDIGGHFYGLVGNDPGVTDGLGALNVGLYVKIHGIVTYRDKNAADWQAATEYAVNDIVAPTAYNPINLYRCTVAGTSGDEEPTWPTTGTIVDNGVTWTTLVAPVPAYFYLWDGANRTDQPVNDGNERGAVGVRIAHSGWIADPDGTGPEVAGPVVPWTSWVEVEGPVSVNLTVALPNSVPEIIPALAPNILVAGDFTTINSPVGVVISGKNMIGVPVAPGGIGSGDPGGYGQPYEPSQIFSPTKGNQLQISGKLQRWDSIGYGLVPYRESDEPHGPFGGTILGDGYWLTANGAWTISYTARVNNIPQWISPGGTGKVLVANPQNNTVMLDPDCYAEDPTHGIMMHDGAQVVSFLDARYPGGLGWITTKGNIFDNVGQGFPTIGVCDDNPDFDVWDPWAAAWFTWRTGHQYKSMLVPAGFPPP